MKFSSFVCIKWLDMMWLGLGWFDMAFVSVVGGGGGGEGENEGNTGIGRSEVSFRFCISCLFA